MKKPIILKIILISLAIAIDLITKALLFNVDKTLIPGFISSRDVGGVLNTGGAWGILGDSTIFLIIITVIFIGIFIFFDYKWKIKTSIYTISISFIVGGAIGNLIDRIFLGGVRDFLYFEFYPSFPTFNVADSFLCIGIVLMLIYIFFFSSKDFKEKERNNAFDIKNSNDNQDDNLAQK